MISAEGKLKNNIIGTDHGMFSMLGSVKFVLS